MFIKLKCLISNIFGDSINDIDKLVEATKDLDIAKTIDTLTTEGVGKAEIEATLKKQGYTEASIKEAMASSVSNKKKEEEIRTNNTLSSSFDKLAAKIGISSNALKVFSGALTIVAVAFVAYQQYARYMEELVDTAKEATETYQRQTETVEDLMVQYEELSAKLKEASGDEEETYRIKKQLLEVQKSLNETFGDEYENVNLVTGAYESQIKTLNEYNKEKANVLLNENKTAFDKAESEMTKTRKYNLGNSLLNHNINDEVADQVYEIFKEYENIDFTSSGIIVSGTAEQVSDTINEITTKVRELQKEYKDSDQNTQNMFEGFYSNVEFALNKTKSIIDEYKDLYNQKQMAEIITDSSMSSDYNKAVEAVEKYNEAVLKSENVYEDETVKSAYENLQKIKKELFNDNDWSSYSNILDETFAVAEDKYYSFWNDIKNDSSMSNILSDLGKYQNVEVESMINDGDNGDSFDLLRDKAKEYGLELEEVLGLLIEIGIVKNAVSEEEPPKTTAASRAEMIADLNDMSEGFEVLDKIYASIQDKDPFDFKLLDEKNFKDTFGVLDSYEDFFETITSNADDIGACKEAFNTLVTEWIESTGILNNVTEENEKLTAAMLKQMGVVNADEVAHYALEKAKAKEYIQSQDNIEVTASNINTLIEEANAAGITTSAYLELVAKEILFNDNDISTESKCEQILNIANAAGVAASTISALNSEISNVAGKKIGSGARTEYAESKGVEVIHEKDRTDGKKNGNLYVVGGKEFDDFTEAMQYAEAYNTAQNIAALYEKDYTPKINYGGGSTANKEAEDAKQSFDWVEKLISKIQRGITNIGKTVDATYKKWTTRNSALSQQLSAVNDEITAQQNAYATYMSKANSVGLSYYYQSLVQSGAYSIQDISDETLKEQIQEYQEWYDKALDAYDAISDLEAELVNLTKSQFDNVISAFEDELSVIEHKTSMIEGELDQIEAKGYLASTKYYEKLKILEEANIRKLSEEYDKLQSELTKAMANGDISAGSEMWYDMQASILDVKEALQEANTQLIEYQNNLRELEWEVFDKTQEMISQVQGESDWLIDLMSNEKMYDDNGNWTEYADATAGLHAVNYNAYMAQADDYAKEIEEINKDLAKDPYNTLLLERRNELLEAQRDMISSAEDEKQAIKDLVSEGYNTMLEALQEMIDKRKEALQAEKDLYDYEKTISEKTKNISSLEKQLQSYEGDTSEETQAKIQQIKVDLEAAKEDLEQTEYDKWLSDQEQMLDTLADDTEQWINERIDDIDAVIREVIASTNTNSESINNTLEEVTGEVGITLTDEMKAIWGEGSVVAQYGEGFNTQLTGVNTTLTMIKDLIAQMVVSLSDNLNKTEGWVNNYGAWTYEKDGQPVKNEWVKHTDGKWYHLNDTGFMDTNTWVQNDSGTWSYVGGSGAAVTGWQKLDWNGQSDWYAFDDEGNMKENEWVGDYFVGANGKMLSHTWVGHNGKYYYVGDDGKWLDLPGWTMNKKPNDGYPIYEYAKGSKHIPYNQIAWTQEKGSEIIYRSSDGAMLTPLGRGDKVFTAEMTQRLWDIAKTPDVFSSLTSTTLPKGIVSNGTNNNIQNDVVMNISLPNVVDGDSFLRAIQTDKRIEKALQSITLGNALGKNSLNKFKY